MDGQITEDVGKHLRRIRESVDRLVSDLVGEAAMSKQDSKVFYFDVETVASEGDGEFKVGCILVGDTLTGFFDRDAMARRVQELVEQGYVPITPYIKYANEVLALDCILGKHIDSLECIYTALTYFVTKNEEVS